MTPKTAARTGSFKEAAIELNVAQSAIWHHMAHLAEYLHSPLFVRHFRSVELTPQGREYFQYITKTFDLLRECTRKILRQQRELAGVAWDIFPARGKAN